MGGILKIIYLNLYTQVIEVHNTYTQEAHK